MLCLDKFKQMHLWDERFPVDVTGIVFGNSCEKFHTELKIDKKQTLLLV